MVSPHPLFTRWARENEKVSYRFATTITKTFIGSSFPMDFTRRVGFFPHSHQRAAPSDIYSLLVPLISTQNISKATLQSLQAVDSFTTFLLDTIVSFPPPPSPSTTPPTFPAAHRHQFASSMEQVGYVMSTYEQQPQLQLTPNERDRIEATFKILYCVRRFMRATSTDAWREELTQLGGYVRWYECEGIAVFSTGQCVELKEGEVMQACGGVSFLISSLSGRESYRLTYLLLWACSAELSATVAKVSVSFERSIAASSLNLPLCPFFIHQLIKKLTGRHTRLPAGSPCGVS